MPKFIVLEAVTKYNDEDSATIKKAYIDNFIPVVYTYGKQKKGNGHETKR